MSVPSFGMINLPGFHKIELVFKIFFGVLTVLVRSSRGKILSPINIFHMIGFKIFKKNCDNTTILQMPRYESNGKYWAMLLVSFVFLPYETRTQRALIHNSAQNHNKCRELP